MKQSDAFLRSKKFKISQNFFLVYSPERISPEIKIKKKGIKSTTCIIHLKYAQDIQVSV